LDLAIIVTYRCNSRCSMCNVWKNPSLAEEEISLETLAKLPDDFGTINLTGGEPTLRSDLSEMVELLYPKTRKLEISSNGLLPKRIEPIIRKHPDIRIRFSLEGTEQTNNEIRGEKNGFRTKVDGLARLKELGGTDLGFAAVIQDDNATNLLELFRFADKNGYELSTSTLHNGFQFYKNDNAPYDRLRLARYIEGLIVEELKTNSVKNWFRAYLDLGLIARVLGNRRLLACRCGYECAFIDPWGDVFACNVRPDLYMGNLEKQSWQAIVAGEKAVQALRKVDACEQNCWMVGSAKTAMRNSRFTQLPRLKPLLWVIENKLRVLLGLPLPFESYVDYPSARPEVQAPYRPSHLNESVQRRIQTRNEGHYSDPEGYSNQ